jgi:hypothetical protein
MNPCGRRYGRPRDLVPSVAPVVAVGAIMLIATMSVLAYFVFTMPADDDYQGFVRGED